MAYNINNFVKVVNQGDRNLQIIDSSGTVRFSVNPYQVLNVAQNNNLLKINLKSGRVITLDFQNSTEAIESVLIIQQKIDDLVTVTPFTIDKDVENWVEDVNLITPEGGTLSIWGHLLPGTTSTYNIGSPTYEWHTLYVGSQSLVVGGVTISSASGSILMSSMNLGTVDNPLILSYNGIDLLLNGTAAHSSVFLTTDKLVNGNLELQLNNRGSLNIPTLFPITFSAVCDNVHSLGTYSIDDENAWVFEVQFRVLSTGSIETAIPNIFPILNNPGYVSGNSFRFTESDHGIPGYDFEILLDDVVLPGGAGWTSNILVSSAPDYPSTINSTGVIKITSNNNSLIIGTSGKIITPDGLEISNEGGENLTWLGRSFIEVIDDGITIVTNETRSHLYSEIGEIGLDSYVNPDGPANTIRGRVRTFPGGVILEGLAEQVGATSFGRVTVSGNGIIIGQNDGVLENEFIFGDNFYINNIDYLSKGGTLSQSLQINSDNYDYSITGADNLILSSTVFDVVSQFVSLDSDGSGQILMDEDLSIMAGGEITIIGSSSNVTITGGKGLVYTQDYSATFVNNSLVTKKFVLDNLGLGPTGSNGPTGSQGATGPQGPTGLNGDSLNISNFGDNRILTSDGTATGSYAETNLTFDGSNFTVTGTSSLNGHTILQQTSEVVNSSIVDTSTVNYDFTSGSIWYHGTASNNFTANFTNLPTDDNRAITTTIIINQGVTPYIPTSIEIDGTPQTLKWSGGTASGNANSVDIAGFTFIRVGGNWVQVLGQINNFE